MNRKALSGDLRSKLLMANSHVCCICQKGGVQIHHIDSNPSNNNWENLSVLCLEHHSEATNPKGLVARLKPEEVTRYKEHWENECLSVKHKIARSRTAFFMVDYKNAERIRQLYSQLKDYERVKCYETLVQELQEENELRNEQGFNVSIEPNLSWSTPVIQLIEEIPSGTLQPKLFENVAKHPLDNMYPDVHAFEGIEKAYYDIWCQLMIRCLILVRRTYDIVSVMKLDNPENLELSGSLISFDGLFRGDVKSFQEYKNNPRTFTVLRIKSDHSLWLSKLGIKTHYVNSETAADSLSDGRGNGIFFFRSINSVRTTKSQKIIKFSCSPLIIGSGGGGVLQIT